MIQSIYKTHGDYRKKGYATACLNYAKQIAQENNMDGYKDIAFFHHLIIEKKKEIQYDKSVFRASRTAGT